MKLRLNYIYVGIIIGCILVMIAVFSSKAHASPVVDAVNNVRLSNGVSPLTENAQLNQTAVAHGNYLCRTNTWSHGNWQSFLDASGYRYQIGGENLGTGYIDLAETVQHWIASPSHYYNIVYPYTEIGTAEIMCANYQGRVNQTIYVCTFAIPQKQVITKPTYAVKPVDAPVVVEPVAVTPPHIQTFIEWLLSLLKPSYKYNINFLK